MFGFRSDGKKVKNVSLLFRIIPHIMKTRNDSQVYFRQDVPIKFMDVYINKKAQEGVKISYMHIIYAAIIRTIYERPWLNRFVMDGRTYDRNDIFVSLTIKKSLEDNAPETVIKLKFTGKETILDIKEKLENVVNSTFIRIDHKEAIDLLKNSGEKWEFEPSYEEDIAKEHERWLTNYFSVPVFIKNWPAGIKAYYMKLNEDGKTVAGVDLEVPGAGELIGGSQREEKLDVLLDRMKELGVEEESIEWYVNLRRYGGCIHSGFGMGFERLIMYLTGIENIRDVIPYPRTPGSCEF